MTSVCLYFKVHQPYLLETNKAGHLFANDASLISQISDECYLPANEIIQQLSHETGKKFKVSFAISGVLVSLLRDHRPDVLDSFKVLVKEGIAELCGETYCHSLSCLHSVKEFKRQIIAHKEVLKETFDVSPVMFINTALVYNNQVASVIKDAGYKLVLCDENKAILAGRSTGKLYHSKSEKDVVVMMRETALSDDIAFCFDDERWDQFPLTAEKFAGWLHAKKETSKVINLYLDYETFGWHKKKHTGILDFLKALPTEVLKDGDFRFATPTEVTKEYQPEDVLDVPETISWRNRTNENCIWSENIMQNTALKKVYRLEKLVKGLGDEKVLDTWGKLQCADYFTAMKHNANERDRSETLKGFDSPEEFYQHYVNTVTNFESQMMHKALQKIRPYKHHTSFY